MKINSISVFLKDWKSEQRTRYAINSLGMFILVTVSVILFAIGQETITPYLTVGLFWVTIFFSTMSGLSRGFVSEEEKGTSIFLKLIAKPAAIYNGKLIYNLFLIFLIQLFVVVLFEAFFENFLIRSFLLFFVVTFLGNIGIAVSSTTIASIIAKANSKGNLYAVLSFPILLPLILILLELTKKSVDGAMFSEALIELGMLISYNVIMYTVGVLLFDFIWKD